MDIKDQVAWFQRRPPSHLKGLVSEEHPEHPFQGGGHGEPIATGFRLRCRCGSEQFSTSAYLYKGDVFVSPVVATCSECQSDILLYDSDLHGYDPIACGMSSGAHGERVEGAVKQRVGEATPQSVDIFAYYPDDLFDEFSEGQSELFTWLRIVLAENADPDYPLIEFECA